MSPIQTLETKSTSISSKELVPGGTISIPHVGKVLRERPLSRISRVIDTELCIIRWWRFPVKGSLEYQVLRESQDGSKRQHQSSADKG